VTATDRSGQTDRPSFSDRPGFTVRVQFRAGDHDFWGWRRSEAGAARLARRYRAYFRGCGIAAMWVVSLTLRQWRAHAEYSRCRSGECPGPTVQPAAEQSQWGHGGGVGRLLPELAPPGPSRARRENVW
jgi:hypothetical protein